MEIQPTILTGWNVEFFDVNYLYNRAQQVVGKEVANVLSPIGQVQWSDFSKRYKIAGVSVLDYLALYKRFTFSERSSYRLDAIGEYEVGEKKVAYDGTLNELYENDIDKFVEYNLQDVKLVKKIDDKLNFIEIGRGLAHLGHCPYEDVFMASRYLEGAILVYLKKKNIVAPNKPKRPSKFSNDKFVGAYVQEPIKGKHEWVYDLDITSMYPSCIISLNISPETKLGKIEKFTLENGLKVFVVENHKLPKVAYSLSLNVDPVLEGDMAGYLDLTGQLMERGTKNRTKEQFDEEIDFIGAQLSTSSNGIYGESLKKHKIKY